jgi:predicted 3-demethylubiquinone-9 3-methyltransferase (glyoxalase superfamily)
LWVTCAARQRRIGNINRHNAGEEPDKEGTVRHADFMLAGQIFGAMDSAYKHEFTFNEAVSFIIHCETQEEIDAYWEQLSAHPENEQCGWLKDKYGLSWQVVPRMMRDMFKDKDEQAVARVTEAFLKMKKFDIAALEQARKGT